MKLVKPKIMIIVTNVLIDSVEKFEAVKDAAAFLSVDNSEIRKALRFEGRLIKGKYSCKKEIEKPVEKPVEKPKGHDRSGIELKVYDRWRKKYIAFTSITACANFLDMDRRKVTEIVKSNDSCKTIYKNRYQIKLSTDDSDWSYR